MECYHPDINYFEVVGIVYIDDSPIFKGEIRNPVYYSLQFDHPGVKLSDFPFISPYAVLNNRIDISARLFNKKRSIHEIVTYESIKKRGWQIVRRPMMGNVTNKSIPRYIYYLRHAYDKREPIGTIMNEQPSEILIQVDNVNKCLRLIGKGVSSHARQRWSSWRSLTQKNR